MVWVMAAIFAGSGAQASEVYIDQAGSSSTFNITQSNGNNRVGSSGSSSGTPSVFSGNNITVDIIQNGTGNEADIQAISATDTVINYNAQGGSNTLEIEIGNSGNELNVVKNGDSNRVTMCGTKSGTGASATCATAVGVVDTTNNINIDGSNNSVNLALASANAVNNINIGQTLPSDGNIVNITQSGNGLHNVGLVINGDTNLVNITQQ
jgi:hypothetical protein